MTPAEIQALRDLHAHGCAALGIHPEGAEGRAFHRRVVEAYQGAKGEGAATGVVPLPRETVEKIKGAGKPREHYYWTEESDKG